MADDRVASRFAEQGAVEWDGCRGAGPTTASTARSALDPPQRAERAAGGPSSRSAAAINDPATGSGAKSRTPASAVSARDRPRCGDSRRRCSAAARRRTSAGGAIRQSTPSVQKSSNPLPDVTISGVPIAFTSSATLPKPSHRDGQSAISAARMARYSSSPGTCPSQITRFCADVGRVASRLDRVGSNRRSPPAPARTRRARGARCAAHRTPRPPRSPLCAVPTGRGTARWGRRLPASRSEGMPSSTRANLVDVDAIADHDGGRNGAEHCFRPGAAWPSIWRSVPPIAGSAGSRDGSAPRRGVDSTEGDLAAAVLRSRWPDACWSRGSSTAVSFAATPRRAHPIPGGTPGELGPVGRGAHDSGAPDLGPDPGHAIGPPECDQPDAVQLGISLRRSIREHHKIDVRSLTDERRKEGRVVAADATGVRRQTGVLRGGDQPALPYSPICRHRARLGTVHGRPNPSLQLLDRRGCHRLRGNRSARRTRSDRRRRTGRPARSRCRCRVSRPPRSSRRVGTASATPEPPAGSPLIGTLSRKG